MGNFQLLIIHACKFIMSLNNKWEILAICGEDVCLDVLHTVLSSYICASQNVLVL